MKMRFILILNLTLILTVNKMQAQINDKTEIITLQLAENGDFPNNAELPVLLYKNVFEFDTDNPARLIEKILSANNWGGSWRNGIYDFQHYHSTAHEALGVYRGWAEVQLGGPGNKTVKIEQGDLVVLPAGTAHKRMISGDGFAVVGAYPDGQKWDMNYGKTEECIRAKQNIPNVKIPSKDPVFGEKGKMFEFWK